MEHIVIEQEHVRTEFGGDRIAGPVSTQGSGERPRWMDFTIWTHSNGGYVLYRKGSSVVYHDPQTTVYRSGKLVTVDLLPDAAVPCFEAGHPRNSTRPSCNCRPPYPDELADDQQVSLETPRHTIDRCETAADVVARLTRAGKRTMGVMTNSMSEPVKELLSQAIANDEGFRDLFSGATEKPVETLK